MGWEVLFLLLCGTIVGTSSLTSDNYRTVKLSKGVIRGGVLTSYGNQTGAYFLGIPFAAPPIGKLRFQKPQPPSSWKGTLDALEYKAACIANPAQTFKTKDKGTISEDCLHVNVFASDHCLKKGACAVMAVLHGGNFNFESPVIFKKDIIVNNFANEERNVVVVTVAYRLGALGWFNLAPALKASYDSNAAVRDILFALEWIQEEISNFGGDPKRVTVIGHSAGAILANFIGVSPRSIGLMQQMVIMSGSDTGNDLCYGSNGHSSARIASILGCAGEGQQFTDEHTVETVLDCIRSKPALDILAAHESLADFPEDVVGPTLDGKDGVFPDYIYTMTESARPLNIMIGTVTGEMRESRNAADISGSAIPARLRELCTNLGYEMSFENPEAFVEACYTYYNRPNMTQMLDDHVRFYHQTSRVANAFSGEGKGRAYVYSYSYANAGDAYVKYQHDNSYGPNHSEDYIYIFGLHRNKFTAKDYAIERIYSGMIANFVNSGDPSYGNEKWTPWKKETRNYFHIDFDDNLKMPGNTDGYYNEASLFWDDIANKVGGKKSHLTLYPPNIDYFLIGNVLEGLVAAWKNTSNTSDKPTKGEMIYQQWNDNLPRLIEAHDKKKSVRAASVVPDDNIDDVIVNDQQMQNTLPQRNTDTLNVVLILLAVTIVYMFCYVVIRKIYECRLRKEYTKY